MQGDFAEKFTNKWNNLCQSVNKPIAALSELNTSTFNKFSKSTGMFDEFTQAKRPEDLVNAQMKLANATLAELTKYSQEFCSILLNFASEAGNIFADTVNEVTACASETVKSAAKGKAAAFK